MGSGPDSVVPSICASVVKFEAWSLAKDVDARGESRAHTRPRRRIRGPEDVAVRLVDCAEMIYVFQVPESRTHACTYVLSVRSEF